MDKSKIGKEFEKEAFEILKNKFDKVEWLSKDKKSPFDFKCVKDGKTYFGEAKLINSYTKPLLNYHQKEADFVIAKIKGKIDFIFREDFDDKVLIQKEGVKAITVPDELWRKLNKAKYDLNLHTISDVIERLFNIVKKINLEEKKK